MINGTEIVESIPIEPVDSEKQDEASEPPAVDFEITTYPADYPLEVLNQKLVNGEIEVPRFQRGFVWDLPRASLLIDSFMMGLPVPQIFLYTDDDQKLLVIDGQQRLKTVAYFFEGLWKPKADGSRDVFRLRGINEHSPWFNKTYAELSDTLKRRFKLKVLRAVVVKQLNPANDTSVYYIFERLNTGGEPLRGQEIRNSVYHGRLNDLLVEDLNVYPSWRSIVGRALPDYRMKDIELILRYMALYHLSHEYRTPMKDFLSAFMRRQRNPNSAFLSQETDRFKSTCDQVVRDLGPRAFSPRGPLNTSIFDAVFVTIARHPTEHPPEIAARYKRLLDNKEFDALTHFGTTSESAVRTRLRLAEEVLFGVRPNALP
jgi:hypothetical protein